jgi:putative hydrolases of HD superfamily
MKIDTERLEKQLSFIREIDGLKNVLRKTKLFDGSRVENDAEHSWHLAIMAIVLMEYSNEKIDILKVLKMVLIHDIVEIDSGDIFLYDNVNNHQNTINEEAAADRIFGILPEDQKIEFIKIWKEFEDRITVEAKFARAIDRFEPIMQNIANKGGAWKIHNINSELIIEKNKIIEEGSQTIWQKVKELIKEAIEKGFVKSN